MQKVFSEVRSYPNNIALAAGTRVVLSSGYLVAASATQAELGVIENRVFATDAVAPVRHLCSDDTVRMIAAGAITQYASVYRAASGKITATAAGAPIGIALEAAAADGDIVEVKPLAAGQGVRAGTATTATASDTIATGLAKVTAVVVSFGTDPADANITCSATVGDQAGAPAAGSFLLKTWKSADGADVTPVAATSFGKVVNWIAFGSE